MAEAKARQSDGQFRERIRELLERRLDPLAAELTSLQATLDAACDRLLSSARATSDAEIEAIDNEIQHRLTEAEVKLQRGLEEVRHASARSTREDHAAINTAIAEIDRQRNQAGVLGATLQAAAGFASRVALFVVRGQSLVGWRGHGFDTDEASELISGLSIPSSGRSLLNDALTSRQTVSHTGAPEATYLSFLGNHFDQETVHAIAVPLVVRDKAAAVLYADTASAEHIDPHPVEALLRVASMAIELLPLRRGSEAIRPSVAPSFATSPLHEPAEATASLSSAITNRLDEPAVEPAAETAAVESIEPPVSEELRQVTEPFNGGGDVSEVEEEASTEASDPREHLNAQRFARFLIGEIKLYQPSRVTEGCRRADLYDRLKDEIERSRKLYDRHVPSKITAEFDYFYHELVSTLADGDETKLGHNFSTARA